MVLNPLEIDGLCIDGSTHFGWHHQCNVHRQLWANETDLDDTRRAIIVKSASNPQLTVITGPNSSRMHPVRVPSFLINSATRADKTLNIQSANQEIAQQNTRIRN